MKRLITYLIVMAAFWAFALKVDDLLERRAPVNVGGPGEYSVFFRGPALKVLSIGYDTAVADYIFMKMIQYFAYQDDHNGPMPNVTPMVEAITDIDPGFAYVYQFAWNVLLDFDARPIEVRIAEGGNVIRKGWRNNPDSWRVAQDLAFHNYYYEGNFEQAANMYDEAYRLRGTFPLYAQLAARLRSDAGKPELALMALQQQYEEARDPRHREVFEFQMKHVRAEIIARKLDEYVEKYREDMGRFPDSLDDLVAAGYIERIPPDGLGGTFKWNPEEYRVESTVFGRLVTHFADDYSPPWKKEESEQQTD